MSENGLILVNVYMAREPWQRLAGLKLPPHTAYKLLKYVKKVGQEAEIIETGRVKLIREVAGVPEGEVSLQPDTPEFSEFNEKFAAMLNEPCDLELFPVPLEKLLETLGKEQGNALSVADLAQLEPFFAEGDEKCQ